MTSRMRRLAAAVVLAAALLAGAAPASAPAQDNTAIAINTKDDSSLFKLAFSIKQVASDTVDQANAAVAYASCQECQTVAIAIQVLIVTAENPDVVMPENLALAINENCSSCTTMALAYQFVLTDGKVRLTAKGRRELARIRHELHELKRQDLSAEQIRLRTKALVDELRHVLATELVPIGPGGRDTKPPADGDDGNGPPPEEPAPNGTAPTDTAPQDTTTGETQPPPDATTETAPAPDQGTTTTP